MRGKLLLSHPMKKEKIENYSGFTPQLSQIAPNLKKNSWKELKFAIGGDAPKNFLAIYEYEEESRIRKSKMKSWPRYIAKVGHKWYPMESITEYMFNQFGEFLGLKIAESKLVTILGQMRFLSKYFLQKNQSLIHGAEIFAGYIEDLSMVEEIEEKGLSQTLLTFEFTENAIKKKFPEEADDILEKFVDMLLFDALFGNNDRHFYNWGVVKSVISNKPATFAPIYDTARGLFWNEEETKIKEWFKDRKYLKQRIEKYAKGAKPKIGWEGISKLNHFELIEKIAKSNTKYHATCSAFISAVDIEALLKFLSSKFNSYLSKERMELVSRCLVYRYDRLEQIINN